VLLLALAVVAFAANLRLLEWHWRRNGDDEVVAAISPDVDLILPSQVNKG
jgi:hypothetical protein